MQRFTRTLAALKEWGWTHRHLRLREQQLKLNQKLRGHNAYYGVSHNARMLQLLRWELKKHWRRCLIRRNRRGGLNWGRFHQLMHNYPLIPARIVHSTL